LGLKTPWSVLSGQPVFKRVQKIASRGSVDYAPNR
jgi:hypothetical protein